MKRRSLRSRTRAAGLLARVAGAVCGRAQRLIKAGDSLPLVVATYPRRYGWFASELHDALRFTLPSLPDRVTVPYRDALAGVPSLVVADLRASNACSCLGHHHPEVTHGQVTRALREDTGRSIGEIDLAIASIRDWDPLPLAGLAAADGSDRPFAEVRFHAALLAVFLHELEHVAHPERPEGEVRTRSNRFFVDAVGELLGVEFGLGSAVGAVVQVEQAHFA